MEDINYAFGLFKKVEVQLKKVESCRTTRKKGSFEYWYLQGCVKKIINAARILQQQGESLIGCSAQYLQATRQQREMDELKESVEEAKMAAQAAQAAALSK